jgi:hypothetical protein
MQTRFLVLHGLLFAWLKQAENTSSEPLLSAPDVNRGELISSQKVPVVAVGGVKQLPKQRLWLFTPFTQKDPGSVPPFESTVEISAA